MLCIYVWACDESDHICVDCQCEIPQVWCDCGDMIDVSAWSDDQIQVDATLHVSIMDVSATWWSDMLVWASFVCSVEYGIIDPPTPPDPPEPPEHFIIISASDIVFPCDANCILRITVHSSDEWESNII